MKTQNTIYKYHCINPIKNFIFILFWFGTDSSSLSLFDFKVEGAGSRNSGPGVLHKVILSRPLPVRPPQSSLGPRTRPSRPGTGEEARGGRHERRPEEGLDGSGKVLKDHLLPLTTRRLGTCSNERLPHTHTHTHRRADRDRRSGLTGPPARPGGSSRGVSHTCGLTTLRSIKVRSVLGCASSANHL